MYSLFQFSGLIPSDVTDGRSGQIDFCENTPPTKKRLMSKGDEIVLFQYDHEEISRHLTPISTDSSNENSFDLPEHTRIQQIDHEDLLHRRCPSLPPPSQDFLQSTQKSVNTHADSSVSDSPPIPLPSLVSRFLVISLEVQRALIPCHWDFSSVPRLQQGSRQLGHLMISPEGEILQANSALLALFGEG